MWAHWDAMIAAATLDNVANRSAIDLQALLNEGPEKKARIRRNLLTRVKVCMEYY